MTSIVFAYFMSHIEMTIMSLRLLQQVLCISFGRDGTALSLENMFSSPYTSTDMSRTCKSYSLLHVKSSKPNESHPKHAS